MRLTKNVIGLCGYSGSGKTTLVEKLIVCLKLAGQRVSVVKHAHHAFDIDHEGKDSWRHRRRPWATSRRTWPLPEGVDVQAARKRQKTSLGSKGMNERQRPGGKT